MIRPNRQIWLCLHLPALALEVFVDNTAHAEQPDHQPARAIAIIEQQRVVSCSVEASARGVEIAMTLNTAHALCANLLALERQPVREQETLQQLAHWLYRFSPELSIAANNSLLIEIGCCRRLYNGITSLLTQLQHGLAERGHSADLGLAHTRKAAWLLAQHEQLPALNSEQTLDTELLRRQIGVLPIDLMAIDRTIINALEKMGIATLSELAALPLAALGKRFGAEFIRYLQQLLGTHPDPQPAFIPAAAFCAGLSFIDGIHNRQALLFPMKRLLQALCDYLDTRQLLCTTLHWQLHDAHTPQADMSVELMRAKTARGPRYLRDLLELSELKLQNLPLRDAVYALVLRSDNFLPAQPDNLQLFAEHEQSNEHNSLAHSSFDKLIDKLRARLGSDALHYLRYRSVHWPEAASLQQSIANSADPADTKQQALSNTPQPLRPLWLLPEPQALQERDKKLFWPTSLQLSALQILRGPERISNHWWEQNDSARDYYIASASDGRLCWIFRDLSNGQWFAHGLFA